MPGRAMDATFFSSPEELRAWFAEHHERADELWVGFHRRASGRGGITWAQAVDEALCVGWIDGVRRGVDEHDYAIRFTPRRRTSHWSRVNVARMAALRDEGRVLPAGERAFAARTEENTGRASYERDEPATLEPEQEARLRADDAAWRFFCAQPPSYRRTAIHWVVSAKRPETRERRLATLIEDSAHGRQVGPLRRR